VEIRCKNTIQDFPRRIFEGLPEFQVFLKIFISSVVSMNQMKDQLPKWDKEIHENRKAFKSFYNFVFCYLRPGNQKSLPFDTAIPTWKVLFGDKYPVLHVWNNFIQDVYKKPISKDTWEQFYEFVTTVKTDLSNYDQDSAWPVVFDDFSVYVKKSIK
jgi:DCN1-like protein 1/2